ncbi:hypothetical protein OUZ56_021248 [Daphnia magna]|uniref:Uncharacterized protein n=1 Tax=Daphnia magna TaxID=35525 RepID=A0ABQ9ZGU6_9CRUS|nr:hypothetical protein OUZ56_021248 [Daphnia magna]
MILTCWSKSNQAGERKEEEDGLHYRLYIVESIYFNFSTYLSFVRLGNKDAKLERMCPAHVSTTAIKNTGKKKKY